ncbi:hypothetical protein P3T36_007829 [Kitasatospora sp. MAP12-15]|uniref:hypothetical protein n=1 Tax=unclassified Kitasatospora TaxID=2633591 RepID=UPI002475DC0A|nr:hypothetical protein [Kitasatospora sp. MAP12-44]MDH6115622.1 hypothetical protein [Kitasatospora sp. MAP12-44]
MIDQPLDGMATSFTVERRFRVWRYTVSHLTLLLRSAAWREGEETVDVWFDGVRAMNLQESFGSLTVRAADPKERDRMVAHAADIIRDPVNRPPLCLILASGQSQGSIVCAHVRVTAHTREPGVIGPPKDFDPAIGRPLWSAGPTGNPTPRHGYTLHEAGRTFLRAQHAKAEPGRQLSG